MKLRRANERGRTETAWLDSRHTFSFADYYDPEYIYFGALRVINEDIVSPNTGFGAHPHRDMEIVTYVLSGQLEHKDSIGNGSIIPAATVQRMTAGTGVTHSEWNPSETESVHFFQIWLLPNKQALTPGYEQKDMRGSVSGQWQVLASGKPDGGGVFVNQDVSLKLIRLGEGAQAKITVEPDRIAWLHTIDGQINVGEIALNAGDSLGIEEPRTAAVTANGSAKLFWFDLSAQLNG